MESTHPRSSLGNAAENGLWLGIYLSALAILTATSLHFSPASLLVWGGSIYLPFFFYRLQLKCYATSEFRLSFISLWSQGIAIFMFASLILAVVCYLGLRFIVPDLIVQSWNQSMEVLAANPSAEVRQLVNEMNAMIEQTGFPGPVDIAAQMISTNIIGGSILALITSAILSSRYSSESRRREYFSRHNKHD